MLTYKELTNDQFIKVIDTLYNGNYKEKSIAENMITNTVDLSDDQKFLALEYGGVDNWHGYDYAIERAEEDGLDWSDLYDEDKLNYLENEGVDNWSGYDESIREFKLNYYSEYLSNDAETIEDLKDYLSYNDDKAEIFNQKANELFGDE